MEIPMYLFIIFIIALFFGLLAANLYTAMSRGGIESKTIFGAVVQFSYVIASFSIVIWGFIILPWWLPIVSFIGLSLVVAQLVFTINRNTDSLGLLYVYAPVFGLVNIALTAYAWFYYFTNIYN